MIPVANGRDAALLALEQVERGGAFASVALDRILAASSHLVPAEGGLATELVYGVLRNQARLDRALRPLASRGLKRAHPVTRRALRLAAFQILMLDRIPTSAAVNAAVEVVGRAVDRRAAGFVNAVLRRLSREGEPPLPDPDRHPMRYLQEATSLPGPIAALVLERLPAPQAVKLGDALLVRPPVTVRSNQLLQDRDELARSLGAAHPNVSPRPTRHSPDGLHLQGAAILRRSELFTDGAMEIQDEAAQLVTHLLAPLPGERVLDACAGRGGKTLHLAALTGDRAELVAADSSEGKLGELRRRAQRAGLAPLRCLQVDLAEDPEGAGAPLLAEPRGPFDRVLLDAPCSGLGVLRRHPESKWRFHPRRMDSLVSLQRRLLHRVASLVRPGGLLVYAVCTFTLAEGPEQVRSFLEDHPHFRSEPPPCGAEVDWQALADDGGDAVQTWPHRHGCDAFFMARLRRKEPL